MRPSAGTRSLGSPRGSGSPRVLGVGAVVVGTMVHHRRQRGACGWLCVARRPGVLCSRARRLGKLSPGPRSTRVSGVASSGSVVHRRWPRCSPTACRWPVTTTSKPPPRTVAAASRSVLGAPARHRQSGPRHPGRGDLRGTGLARGRPSAAVVVGHGHRVAGRHRRRATTGASSTARVGLLADCMLAFPPLILLLGMVACSSRACATSSSRSTILGIPTYIRLSRANTMVFAQREFVLAARALGATNRRIIVRELLPNVILPLLSFAFIVVGAADRGRGRPQLPRPRHPAAHPDLGQHDPRRSAGLRRASHTSCSCPASCCS